MLTCAECEKLRLLPTGTSQSGQWVFTGPPKLPCDACAPARLAFIRRVFRFDEIASAVKRLEALRNADYRAVLLPLLKEDKSKGKAPRKGKEADVAFLSRRNFGQLAIDRMQNRLRRRPIIEADPWIHIRPTDAEAAWLRQPLSHELREIRSGVGIWIEETGHAFVRELDQIIAEFEAMGY